jgi:hypothetical protein
MDSQSDPCSYPNCKKWSVVTLGYADGITLCDKHWTEHCNIELPDEPTIRQVISYERKHLQLHRKCGSRGARRALERLKRDPDNYVLKSVSINGERRVTVAEYREYLEKKKAMGDVGKYFAEDNNKTGPRCTDDDEAHEQFVAKFGHNPLRVLKITADRGDEGVDATVVWEAEEGDDFDDEALHNKISDGLDEPDDFHDRIADGEDPFDGDDDEDFFGDID